MDEGTDALDRGDGAAAVAQAEQALAQDPANSDAYALRAQANFARREYSAAARDAGLALKLDPSNEQARAVLGMSASQAPSGSGVLAGAAATAGALAKGSARSGAGPSAVAADFPQPSDGASPPPTAGLPMSGGRSADFALQSLNAEAFETGAAAKARRHDFEGALSELDRGLLMAPDDEALLDEKAAILNRSKDYPGAFSAAGKVLAGNPQDAFAYFNRANALAGMGDRDGMLAALRRAASLDPSYQTILQEALELPKAADLLFLFPEDAAWRPQARRSVPGSPAHPGRRSWPVFLMGGIGGLLIALGSLRIFVARQKK